MRPTRQISIILILFTCMFTYADLAGVDLNTGKLNFSQTVMTAKGRSVSLPVNLSYNSGIKRGHDFYSPSDQIKPQRSSWTGLGFDLDMPYIERIPRGAPDNASGSTTDYLDKQDKLRSTCSTLGLSYDIMGYDKYNYLPLFGNYDTTQYVLTEDSDVWDAMCPKFRYQTYQDQYVINGLPGGSGQIYFANDSNQTVHFSNYNPTWKIEPTYDSTYYPDQQIYYKDVNKWVLTDGNGTQYVFDKHCTFEGIGQDFTDTKLSYYYDSPYFPSDEHNKWQLRNANLNKPQFKKTVWRWYLSKIKSYDGDSLVIDYQTISDSGIGTQKVDYPKLSGQPNFNLIEQPVINNITKWDVMQNEPYLRLQVNIPISESAGNLFGAFIYVGFSRGGMFNYHTAPATDLRLLDEYNAPIECSLSEDWVFPQLFQYAKPLAGFTNATWSYDQLDAYGRVPIVNGYYHGNRVRAIVDSMYIALPEYVKANNGYSNYTVMVLLQFQDKKIITYSYQNSLGNKEDVRLDWADNDLTGLQSCNSAAIIQRDSCRYIEVDVPCHTEPDGKTIDCTETELYCPKVESTCSNGCLYEPLHWNRNYGDDLPGAGRIKGLQCSLSDNSLIKPVTLFPKSITTNYERIEFEPYLKDTNGITVIPKDHRGNELNRPLLNSISKYKFTNGTKGPLLEKTTFTYAKKYGRQVLADIIQDGCTGSTEKQTLAHYEYEVEPTPKKSDYFGYINFGKIKSITDVNGKKVTYYYEPGNYSRMSSSETMYPQLEKDSCGYRVSKVVVDPIFSKSITTKLSYTEIDSSGSVLKKRSSGEIAFDHAIKYDSGNLTMYPGLTKTLEDFEYSKWKGNRIFLELGSDLRYKRVEIEVDTLKGKTVYEYTNRIGNNVYNDPENEYHLYAPFRTALSSVTSYNARDTVVSQEKYEYEDIDYSIRGLYYKKPKTYVLPISLAKDYAGNPELVQSEDPFYLRSQLGMDSATMYKTLDIRLLSKRTKIDGVEKEETYQYNDRGQLVKTTYGGILDQRLKASNRQYGIDFYGSVDKATQEYFRDKNLFNPIVYESQGYCTKNKQDMFTLQSSINIWGKNPYNNEFYPQRNYVWRATLNRDIATPTFTIPYINSNGIINSPEWLLTSQISKQDSVGNVLETKSNSNRLTNAVVYRPDLNVPIATITNSSFDNCAIYTCDYTSEEWNYAANGNLGHFGNRSCMIVGDNSGPSTTLKNFDKTKDYIFSAWVFPTDTHSISMNVEKLKGNGFTSIGKDTAFTKDELGTWHFIKCVIGSNQLSDVNLGSDYLKIGVAGPSAVFFVDDIRFHPSNALVTTTYYNDTLGLPILTVDANDNPSHRITYDGFGRVIREEKVDKAKSVGDHGNNTKLMTKEYYFMYSSFKPYLLTPTDSGNGTLPPVLQWETVDPTVTGVTFDVYYGTTLELKQHVSVGSAKSTTLSGLSNATQYYWKVKATKGSEVKFSDIGNFTTILQAPTGLTCSLGQSTVWEYPYNLSWNPVPGAAKYVCEVKDLYNNFSAMAPVNDTSVTYTGREHSIIWHVRAIDANGASSFNSVDNSCAHW